MNVQRLINETEDYIEQHLSEKITLEKLARHLNISKYYYHHLFSQNSDETLTKFITRIKMERSAIYMIVCRDISITQIAYHYGYSDSSSFSKAFKRHYQDKSSRISKSKKRQAMKCSLAIMRIGGMSMEHPTIEIKEIEVKVIYVRFKGSYLEFRKNAMKMFKTLEKYAQKHNLLVDQLTKVMTLYHDNPFITDQTT
jgi:AraC family of transcriptional regulator, multidrug resistance transcriptional activator